MKTVVIIAIAVICSGFIVTGVLVTSETFVKSDEKHMMEDLPEEIQRKNKEYADSLTQICHSKYESGDTLQDCLQEVEVAKQETEGILRP